MSTIITTMATLLLANGPAMQEPRHTPNESQAIIRAFADDLALQAVHSIQEPYFGELGVLDPRRDRWEIITQESMLNRTPNPNYIPDKFSLSARIDYNRDGVIDLVQMYENSRQAAVIVEDGASGRSRVIYSQDGHFTEAEQIFPSGEHMVMLNIPDSGYILMLQHDGKPMISLPPSAPEIVEDVFSDLPASIREAAISDKVEGEVAGARIPGTDTFVVYVKAAGLCGSGGCRAQIWTFEGETPVRKESLPVGFLPISILAETDNGMPRLGISVNGQELEPETLMVGFDGETYALTEWDNLVGENEGQLIVSHRMLETFISSN